MRTFHAISGFMREPRAQAPQMKITRRRVFTALTAVAAAGTWRSRHSLRGGALLRRPGIGSLRRLAVFRSARRAAQQHCRPVALVHRPQQGRMAGMGTEPLCRPAAGTDCGRRVAHLVRRARDGSAANGGREHSDRPLVVGARLAVYFHRAETGERSGRRIRRAAADRCGAGVALPLRPSRCRDACRG